MRQENRAALLFPVLLLLFALGCSLSSDLPFGGGGDGGGLSQEDIAVAATRAAEAAATAAAVAGQAAQPAAPSVPTAESALPTAEAVLTGTSLERKLANIQPDANGNFSVTITEDDLNEFVGGGGGGIDTEAFKAQDIQFQITTDHVELTGDVSEPVAVPLQVKLRPTVSGGQLQFELLSASAGLFPLPDSMLNMIESVANSELGRALISLPAGTTLENATLAQGEFTVFGHEN